VSLAIGAIVYVFVIRGILTRRDENNKLIYVNVWPSKIDLEDLIYRPVLKGLATVGCIAAGLVGMMMDKIIVPWSTLVGGFTARLINADAVVIDSIFSYAVKGSLAMVDKSGDGYEAYKDIYTKPGGHSHVTVFRSLSFSLLLFGIGLCGSLFYLLVAGYR